MEIRTLRHEDMPAAIRLMLVCRPEELAGFCTLEMDFQVELKSFTRWMEEGEENNDFRLLLGAFEDEKMVGTAFGSFVESKDQPEEGFELNGLWVAPACRNRGISLKLLKTLSESFGELGAARMIVYNYHHSPSNRYYRKLGCSVIGTEYQTEHRIPVDIFCCGLGQLREKLGAMLEERERKE